MREIFKSLLRHILESANKFILWTKKRRIVRPKGAVVKVNIGSGLTVSGSWINIDARVDAFFSKWPKFVLNILYRNLKYYKQYSQQSYFDILKEHIFIHHNIIYGIPLPDESVNYLYLSHLLEHLYKEDVKEFIKETYRVLKKDGLLRICVPDLEYAISLYQKGDKEKSLAYFFAPCHKAGVFARHNYMYDFALLEQLLRGAGFSHIERCQFQQGKVPDLDKLDQLPEETLYVEARKPS